MKKSLTVFAAISLSLIVANQVANACGAGPNCSPEIKRQAVTVAQNTLTSAASAPEFESAAQFQVFVAKTNALKTSDDKLNAYFGAIGVNGHDADEVAQFIGARDLSPYYTAAEKNLSLTPKQSEILVGKFNQEVKGFVTR